MSEDATRPPLPEQIARVRERIGEAGECRVDCDDLRLLCDGEVEKPRQLLIVARIAQWEGWQFEFREDGSVRFWSAA